MPNRLPANLGWILPSLLAAFGLGMLVHAAAVIAEGRCKVGSDYHYRALMDLYWLIATPQEALGWGAALFACGALLLWGNCRYVLSSRP